VIQANSILIQVNDYQILDRTDLKRRLNGERHLFYNMPGDKDLDNWSFYTRADMTGPEASQKPILAVRHTPRVIQRQSINTDTKKPVTYEVKSWQTTFRLWHYVIATWSDGMSYGDISYSAAEGTMFINPEDRSLMLPTNGYQTPYEALALLMKPVAAGAPLLTPWQTSIGGGNPNSV
jgi:hypothetical protein